MELYYCEIESNCEFSLSLFLSFHQTRLLCKKICFSYDNYPVRANYSHVYKSLRARFVYSSHLMWMYHLAIQIGQYKHITHTHTNVCMQTKNKQCLPHLSAGLIIIHSNNRIILYILYNKFLPEAHSTSFSFNFQFYFYLFIIFDWKVQSKSMFSSYPMWSLHFLIEINKNK